MKHLFSLCLFLLGTGVFAQKVTVVDEETNTPIPYATVVIRNGEYGFVANDSGVIELFNMLPSDVLEFRSIGYNAHKIKYNTIQNGDTIALTSSTLELDEVVVRPIDAAAYVRLALRSVGNNYYPDSFATRHYYREYLKENEQFINHSEAILEAKQTGYLSGKDSFELCILAGHKLEADDLSFMLKERNKEVEKELKAAQKSGQEISAEELKMPLEIGNPPFLLSIDPLRNVDQKFVINDDNVDFLDSNNQLSYDFWYGKPVEFGDQSLVVIHFDQKKNVHKPMLAGTLWIEQTTNAFVKIEFGISEYGQKHMIPGYMKAALWVYGLMFDIKNTLVEFNYQPFKGKWALGGVRLKADVFLEKRRLFSENEKADFTYDCEMLTSSLLPFPFSFTAEQKYDHHELISNQLPITPKNEWERLKRESRSYK